MGRDAAFAKEARPWDPGRSHRQRRGVSSHVHRGLSLGRAPRPPQGSCTGLSARSLFQNLASSKPTSRPMTRDITVVWSDRGVSSSPTRFRATVPCRPRSAPIFSTRSLAGTKSNEDGHHEGGRWHPIEGADWSTRCGFHSHGKLVMPGSSTFSGRTGVRRTSRPWPGSGTSFIVASPEMSGT